MPTDMALMDAWRARSNFWYEIWTTAQTAPGFFKTGYLDQVRANLEFCEKQFNFWRGKSD